MATKDRYLQIRVTPAQKSAIQEAAARLGMDMSAWVLERLLPPPQRAFQMLAAAVAGDPRKRRFALAELNDLLSDSSSLELARAVADPPAAALDPYMANYVAAMVETAAHRADIPPPHWTKDVEPLDQPVFGTDIESLRLHLLLHSPPAFRRRNIFIDASIGDRV